MPNPVECIFVLIALFCIFLGVSFVLSILYSFKRINTPSTLSNAKKNDDNHLKNKNANKSYKRAPNARATQNNVYYVKNYKTKRRKGAKIPFEGVVISPEEFKKRKG